MLVIRDVRLAGGDDAVDVIVQDGDVQEVRSHQLDLHRDSEVGVQVVEGGGGLLLPAFIDTHIHLDKVLIRGALADHDGDLAGAIRSTHEVKRRYTVDDVRRRAREVIEACVLTGSTRLRSHVDVDTIGGLTPLLGVLAAAQDCRDIADVVTIAFPQEGLGRDPGAAQLMLEAMRQGAGVVGGMPHWEVGEAAQREHVRFCFDLAEQFDADVDMHVDETDDGAVRTLATVVEETERRAWHGRVSVGHVCALSAADEAYAADVVAGCARAGITVVSNPVTNLVLQGRGDRGLVRRGTTRVRELLAAGVPVAFGQDCVDDAFYPFGRGDMLEVALISAHAAQLTTTAELMTVLAAVTDVPAAVWHLQSAEGYGVVAGARADLQLYAAATWPRVLRDQDPPTRVWRSGRQVATTAVTRTLRPGE